MGGNFQGRFAWTEKAREVDPADASSWFSAATAIGRTATPADISAEPSPTSL